MKSYAKFGGATLRRFFRYPQKTWGGGRITAPRRARVNRTFCVLQEHIKAQDAEVGSGSPGPISGKV